MNDLELIGLAVLNLSATAVLMHHSTPAGTTDYAKPRTSADVFVRHFALWCNGNQESGDILRAALTENGVLDQMIADLPQHATA